MIYSYTVKIFFVDYARILIDKNFLIYSSVVCMHAFAPCVCVV